MFFDPSTLALPTDPTRREASDGRPVSRFAGLAEGSCPNETPARCEAVGVEAETGPENPSVISRISKGAGLKVDAPRRRWLITQPGGGCLSVSCTPAEPRSEVQARYPDCTVEPEEDQSVGGTLTGLDLEAAYALLRHWDEIDLATAQEWLDGLARDPARLQQMRETAVRLGLACWEEPPLQAACVRCANFQRDRINPAGGLGRCLVDAPASRRRGSLWPREILIRCKEFETTVQSAHNQGDRHA